MDSFVHLSFDIFEIYRKYCEIISGRNVFMNEGYMFDDESQKGIFSTEALNQLLKFVNERRTSILEEIHKVMLRLDLMVDFSEFSRFYDFVFFVCRENGQKNITVSKAVIAWRLVLAGRFRLLDQWCSFVGEKAAAAAARNITEECSKDHGENGLLKYATRLRQLVFGLAHLRPLRMLHLHMMTLHSVSKAPKPSSISLNVFFNLLLLGTPPPHVDPGGGSYFDYNHGSTPSSYTSPPPPPPTMEMINDYPYIQEYAQLLSSNNDADFSYITSALYANSSTALQPTADHHHPQQQHDQQFPFQSHQHQYQHHNN